jgi:hypothetical protein
MTKKQAIAIMQAEQVLEQVGCGGPLPDIGEPWYNYVKEAVEVLETASGRLEWVWDLMMVKAIRETRDNNNATG